MVRESRFPAQTRSQLHAAPGASSNAPGSRRRRLAHDAISREDANTKQPNSVEWRASGSKVSDERDCEASNPLETLHASLTGLGAPPMTQTDLQKALKGAGDLENALRFFEAHIVGRREVNRMRRGITKKLSVNAARLSLDQNNVEHSAYTQHYEASRGLRAAETELERIQREVDNAHTRLVKLEQETDNLQAALRQTRLANALLSVLEKKEKINMRRVEEIGGMLRAIRDEAHSVVDTKSETISDAEFKQDMPRQKIYRADAVDDTVAMLQGHHCRLTRLANNTDPLNLPQAEASLLMKISEAMGRAQNDSKVQHTFKVCLAAARHRASQRFQHASDHQPRIDSQILTALEQQLIEKETRLQKTNARISALRMSCTESLHLLTTFRDSAVPILQESLDEDTNTAKNHVHILRKSIEKGCIDVAAVPSPVQSYQQKITQARANITAEHERRHFLVAATLYPPGDSTRNEDTLSRFRAEQSRFEEGLRKVLQRKVDKSRVGDELVQDIKTLFDEIQTVANVL